MLRIRLFGVPRLVLDGGERPLLGQPKRLPLIALIASAGNAGVSRDRIHGLLWPDADAARARNSLNQLMHALRADLPQEAIVGVHELRLDPLQASVDVVDFVRALERGDDRAALASYAGPFLEGCFASGAPYFDQWVDEMRDAHRRSALGAIRRLALDAAARGRHHEAREWCTRGIHIDPVNEEIVRLAMERSLDAGERGEALQHYAEFVARARRLLDEAPSVELQRLADQLRRDTSPRPAVATHATERARRSTPDSNPEVLDAPTAHEASDAARHEATRPAAPRRARLAAGALAMLVVSGTGGWYALRAPTQTSHRDTLAILPTTVRGDTSHAYLREAVMRALAANLDGTAGATVLDVSRVERTVSAATMRAWSPPDLADRLGATAYVESEAVMLADGTLQLVATLRDVERPGAALGRATSRGFERDLFALLDTLTRDLAAMRGGIVAGAMGAEGWHSTTSLPAFKAFLDAELAFRHGRYPDAVESYQRAVLLDSTYALAYYRLSEAADWIGDGTLMLGAIDRALVHRDRLPARDRALVLGVHAWRHGDFDRAELALRESVGRYPDHAEAWYQLGEVRFHGAPIRGRPFSSANLPFERALHLDSLRSESLTHLLRIAATYRDERRMDSLVTVARERRYPNAAALQLFRDLARGDVRRTRRIIDSLASGNQDGIFSLASATAQYAYNMPAAVAMFERLLQPPFVTDGPLQASLMLSRIAAARGDIAGGLAALSRVPNTPRRAWSLGVRAMMLAMPGAPSVPHAELVALRDSLRRWPELGGEAEWPRDNPSMAFGLMSPTFAAYPIAVLDLMLRDSVAALQEAERLARIDVSPDARELGRALASGIRARVSAAAGDWPRALQALEAIHASISLYNLGSLALFAPERLLHAEALERLGRTDEALARYESLGQGYYAELEYLGLALAARERLLRARGEMAGAQRVGELRGRVDARGARALATMVGVAAR